MAVCDKELEGRTADVDILVETEEERTADVVILDVIEETAEANADVTCELDIVEAVDGLGKKVVSATDSLDGHRKVGMAVVGFGVSGAAVGVLLTFKSFTQQ